LIIPNYFNRKIKEVLKNGKKVPPKENATTLPYYEIKNGKVIINFKGDDPVFTVVYGANNKLEATFISYKISFALTLLLIISTLLFI
jgi:hypothetical protein